MRIKFESSVVVSVAGLAILCCITSFISPDRYMSLYGSVILSKETNRNEEAPKLAQQIFDKKHKVLSRVGNEMTKPDNRIKENGTAGNGGTDDVSPFKTAAQPGQDNPSENETLRVFLPP